MKTVIVGQEVICKCPDYRTVAYNQVVTVEAVSYDTTSFYPKGEEFPDMLCFSALDFELAKESGSKS